MFNLGALEDGLHFKQGRRTTWIEGKVVDEALPGDEGDFFDGGGRTAETQFLQVQQRVDERTSFV